MKLQLQRITTSTRYIPEIDGLRFLAISTVVLYHVWFSSLRVVGQDPASQWLSRCLVNGELGVPLFFMISGFILSAPFALHCRGSGPPVSLRKYFLRRVTRLEPPYLLALLGFYLLAWIMREPDSLLPAFWRSLALRMVYAQSLVAGEPHTLNGVTWSLEVEIQFYLLVPLLVSSFRLPTTIRRMLFAGVMCLWGIVDFESTRLRLSVLHYIGFFVAGFMLTDIFLERKERRSKPVFWWDLLALLAVPCIAFFARAQVVNAVLPWLMLLIGLGGVAGVWLPRLLSRPLIALTGGMCYTIYLLHYPLMSFFARRLLDEDMSLVQGFLVQALVTLPLVAAVSLPFYLLIERPCMSPDWPRRIWFRWGEFRKGALGRWSRRPRENSPSRASGPVDPSS